LISSARYFPRSRRYSYLRIFREVHRMLRALLPILGRVEDRLLTAALVAFGLGR
jgi:hypothetical protein